MQAGSGKKLYSIVIPTRERHDVLEHALRTVLRQTRPNFEVVVMDNFSSPETKAVVDAAASPHVRYVRAPERLTMLDNWELGLQHARGDYVTVLGDDDGLMPDAVEIAEQFHAEHPGRIVTWKPLMWFWPNFFREPDRGLCYAHISARVEIRRTRDVLRRVFSSKTNYVELPTIYYSFVPRQVIEDLRARRGRYFDTINPDIYSGLINAVSVPDYVYSFRPLSVVGMSKHSTGMSCVYSELDSRSVDKVIEEYGAAWDPTVDERLAGAFIPEVKIADGYLKFKAQELADDPEIEFDIAALLQTVCRVASRYNARHGEVVAAIREMAVRNGLDPDQFVPLPPAAPREGHRFSYVTTNDSDLVQMSYHTNETYVRTIDDFVATAGRLCVPPAALRVFDVRPGAAAPRAVASRYPGLSRARRLIRSAMGQLHLA